MKKMILSIVMLSSLNSFSFSQVEQEIVNFVNPPVPLEKSDISDQIGTYQAPKNETLMLVAFKIYGNYHWWHALYKLNKKSLRRKTYLTKGQKILFKKPKKKFEWEVYGKPYLIKRNDTLVRISFKEYETGKYWRHIWYNNRPVIQNPNIVFRGFTIYLPEIMQQKKFELAEDKGQQKQHSGRQIASEKSIQQSNKKSKKVSSRDTVINTAI